MIIGKLVLLFFTSVAAQYSLIETREIQAESPASEETPSEEPPSKTELVPLTVEQYIAGGEKAKKDKYPWIAKSVNGFGTCTGSLVHSDFVLTAAHCQGVFQGGVYVSAFKFDNRRDGSIYREVDRHFRNPGYNFDNDVINNDIMLIRLAEPVTDVAPVPLNNDAAVPGSLEDLIVLGFGLLELEGDRPEQLMEVTLNHLAPEECETYLDQFENVDDGPDILCAFGRMGDESTCSGDSGGPIITSDGVQVGVVSFGVNCETRFIPNGFARVSHFYDWIQDVICRQSKDRPSDCPELEEPNPRTVYVNVTIKHDAYPQETTWAIRNKADGMIAVVGPIGNPTQLSTWITTVPLLPGEYTLEIYDSNEDGMGGTTESLTGWFHVSTDASGELEFLIPLTFGFFPEILLEDFFVPEIEFSPRPSASPPPSSKPTNAPSIAPTHLPSLTPSVSPSTIPSQSPSLVPSVAPSMPPSTPPSVTPSLSSAPTQAKLVGSDSPSQPEPPQESGASTNIASVQSSDAVYARIGVIWSAMIPASYVAACFL